MTQIKSFSNTLIYYSGYLIKNRAKPLYLTVHKIYGYTEVSNENKYLTIIPVNEGKGTLKSMKNYKAKSEILFG